MITVKKIDETRFEVTVENDSATTHRVRLSDNVYVDLTKGQITKEALIQRAFEFLLQRESNTMILRSFELPVIGRYFPEFENEMRRSLSK